MNLKAALDIQPGELVTFVGAGSKTTVAWRLLRLLVASGERVIYTTTTYIFEPRGTPLLLSPDPEPGDIARMLIQSTMLVLASTREPLPDSERSGYQPSLFQPTRLLGLKPQMLNDMARRMPGVTWLVEADETKRHRLGMPTDEVPIIPTVTDRLVISADLEALDHPLGGDTIDHPQLAGQLLRVSPGTLINPQLLAGLVSYTSWKVKNTGLNSSMLALLIQQDDRAHPQAPAVAKLLLSKQHVDRVVLVGLSAADPVLKVWT